MQFMVLSLFAIPVGIAGGFLTARTLIRLMLSSIGTVHIELDLIGPAVITFLLLTGLVSLTAGVAGARAGRIKAASSIRFGAPEEAHKMRVPVHLRAARYLPLPLVIGLKQLASGKKRELYDLLTVTATAFVLFFSVNTFYSMTMVGRNLPFWGFDASDVAVKVGDTSFAMRYETIKEYLSSQPGVRTLGGTSITQTVVVIGSNGTAMRQTSGHVVDGDMDALGFINLRGTNPDRAGEVSLGVTTARDFGVDVGEKIDITVSGQTMSFEVTAVFQGTSNGGNWYRMTVDSYRLADPAFEPEQIAVVLDDVVDRDAFMHEIEAQLGDAVDLETAEKFVEAQVGQLVAGIGVVVTFLSAVFLAVSAVSVFNSTTMGIHESKRQLGVFKALGYTQAQIRSILVSKSGILAVVAIVAGAILCRFLAGTIVSGLTSQLGMPEFPMMIQPLWSIVVIPVVIGLCMISAWIPSNRIANITARTLIVE
jgi:putative ABC transport system permease protein